jgi:hypothetical protein
MEKKQDLCRFDEYGRFELLDPALLDLVSGGAKAEPMSGPVNAGCTNSGDCTGTLNNGACTNTSKCRGPGLGD